MSGNKHPTGSAGPSMKTASGMPPIWLRFPAAAGVDPLYGIERRSLPAFELVPSDVPLSILESMALSKAVIGTTVACIPELLAEGRGFLVPPAREKLLAEQWVRGFDARPEQRVAGWPGLYVEEQRTWADMGRALERVLVANGHGLNVFKDRGD